MRYVSRAFWGLALVLSSFAVAQTPPRDAAMRAKASASLLSEAPRVLFYETSDTIRRVYGVPFGGGVNASDAFSTFVTRYGNLFAPGDSELEFVGDQDIMDGKFVAGYFRQRVDGIPVDKGHLTLLSKDQIGYPLVLASSNVQTVHRPLPVAKVNAKQAVALAKKNRPSLKQFTDPELWVWTGEGQHLAWAFRGENPEIVDHEYNPVYHPALCGCSGTVAHAPERYYIFVDAISGRILEERNEVFAVDVSGRAQGWATPGFKPDQTNNPPTLQDLELIRASITGGNNAYSNATGHFVIPNAGTANVTVNLGMLGRWVNVVDFQGSTLALSQVVTPPGPANFIHNPAPAQAATAQVNGFIQTTRVHNFAKAIIPTYPGIDIAITCTVNRNSTCNAYYTNSTINFYASGGGCPNTAYSTVVWHEYGHFIIDMGHPFPTGAYHEGMADVTAAFCGDTPWLGEDFRGPNTGPLRSCYNSITYPSTAEAHTAGQVISGAFWLTYDELKLTEGNPAALERARSWYLNSILLHPPAIDPGITIDVLTLDDNDGDIYNGTPHYDEIATGFGAKNLHAPKLEWVKYTKFVEPPAFMLWNPNDIVSPAWLFRVLPNVNPVGAPVVLKYRFNGGAWQSRELINYADPGWYILKLALPPCGTVVDWYLTTEDTQGHESTYPFNAPADLKTFIVAQGLQTILEDTFETNLGWGVTNQSLTSGAWVRANPNGTTQNGQQANPEDDSSDPGAQCYFTGQGTVGGSVGAADVDGGPTILTSPLLNLQGDNAIVEYSRWFYNDDGDDVLYVEISNDNGNSWVQVEAVMGIQNSWVRRSFQVGQYVTPSSQVRVRFRVADNPNNSITEAGVDHFVVKRLLCN